MRAFAALSAFMALSYLNCLVSSRPLDELSESPPSNSLFARGLNPSLWIRPKSPMSILITAFPSEYATDLHLLISAYQVIHERTKITGINAVESAFNFLGRNDLILRLRSLAGEELTLIMIEDVLSELFDYFSRSKEEGMLAAFTIFYDGKEVGEGTVGVL